MTKLKTRSIIYTLSLILLVGVLAFSVALIFVRSTQNAYADYETDILYNSQAIVNFNQLFDFDSASSSGASYSKGSNGVFNITSTGTFETSVGVSISFLRNNVYYVYVKSDNGSGIELYRSGVTSVNFYTAQLYIPNFNNSLSVYLRRQNNNTNTGSLTFYCINLTQMFGSGNEPNLLQCQELFVSDYYSYNTGTAVAYSEFNAYAQGVQSVLGSNVVLSSEYIINNANPFTLPYNLYPGKIYYNNSDYDPDNGSDTLITDGLYFLNGAYVPFGTTLPSGTNVYIKYDYAFSYRENAKCNIYSMNSKNELSLIAIVDNDMSFSSAEYNYVITSDSIGIVFNIDTNDNIRWSFNNLSITYPVNNYEQILQNAYQSGYISAKSFYDSYYSQNGTGYQAIYDLGYSVGINASANDFANTYYTFPQFLGALFDVPVQVLTSLLDFDVFGFNMKNLVFSLITLAIVFAIVRLILMKTGEGK